MGTRITALLASLALTLPAPASCAPAAAGPPVITVAGNALLADGRPWVPGGVNIIGLLRPRPSGVGASRMFDRAWAEFSPRVLAAAKAYGANVVRYQVSQPALDPESPGFVQGYRDHVAEAVRAAQRLGLTVVLSMQWQKGTGVAGLPTMPGASTARAWAQLAPPFAGDRTVILEAFNEPNLPSATPGEPPGSPRRWDAWQRASQAQIDQLRRMGVRGVIMLDGMQWAHMLDGAPPVRDPLDQVAYAVHPYPTPGKPMTPEGWDDRFGKFASSHPVVVSEWIMDSGLFCQADAPQVAASLLDYARDHRIGFIAWAFDAPGSLVRDFGFEPTTYKGFRCGSGGGGPGQVFQRFLTQLPR